MVTKTFFVKTSDLGKVFGYIFWSNHWKECYFIIRITSYNVIEKRVGQGTEKKRQASIMYVHLLILIQTVWYQFIDTNLLIYWYQFIDFPIPSKLLQAILWSFSCQFLSGFTWVILTDGLWFIVIDKISASTTFSSIKTHVSTANSFKSFSSCPHTSPFFTKCFYEIASSFKCFTTFCEVA